MPGVASSSPARVSYYLALSLFILSKSCCLNISYLFYISKKLTKNGVIYSWSTRIPFTSRTVAREPKVVHPWSTLYRYKFHVHASRNMVGFTHRYDVPSTLVEKKRIEHFGYYIHTYQALGSLTQSSGGGHNESDLPIYSSTQRLCGLYKLRVMKISFSDLSMVLGSNHC